MRNIQYVAGFFDADGCVSINRKTYRSVRVLFYNDSRDALEEIQRVIGKKPRRVNARKKPSGKVSFYLSITDRMTLYWLVPELIELCIVKKKKLEVAKRVLDKLEQEDRERESAQLGRRYSSRSHWSQEERRILRNNQTRHISELLDLLPERSAGSITYQLKKLRKAGRLK